MLGGRYVLKQRLDDAHDSSTWRAQDDTLDRRVHLRAVAAEHPHAEAVLDAARRAAAVEDARLVRVLDVGHDDAVVYVVCEWLGAPSVAERLRSGPLSAAHARTVVGEAALALEAARHRGLHHLRLTPEHVHLLDDGSVKVTALATAAALDGVDVGTTIDSDEATRTDTRDLIALAYATLTATWPLPTGSDLPPAPQLGGHPVAPSQIVTGAPADLDTLCAQTFAGAGAPDTPGDLAGQIAPWGRQRVDERAGGTFPHALPPTRRAPLPTAPTPARSRPAEQPTRVSAAPATAGAAAAGAAAAGAAAAGAAAENGVPAPSGAALPSPPAAAPPTAPVPPVHFGAGPAQLVTNQLPVTAAGSPGTFDSPSAGDTSVFDALYDHERLDDPDDERDGTEEEPQRAQTRTVLLLVGIFVVVFLTLAYCGLRGLGKTAFTPAATPSSTAPSASATTTTEPSQTSTTSSSTSAQPISINSATGFDPEGDGSEKNNLAPLAFDGNVSSSWTSDTYKTAQFGGLKKGVGLLLDFGSSEKVTQVQVRLGAGGGTVQLRTANGGQLDDTVYAQVTDAAGTITLRPQTPLTTSDIVLWFTQAAQVSGGYRAEVAEVTVS